MFDKQTTSSVLLMLLIATPWPASAAGNVPTNHNIRGMLGEPVVGTSKSAGVTITSGFWPPVRRSACSRPARQPIYSNVSGTDFWWGAPNEFGDLVTLLPSPATREVVALRLRLRNGTPSDVEPDVVIRFYPGPPEEGAPISERSYRLFAPVGESSATLAISNVEVGDTLAFTIEGLPAGLSLAWNDAPTLGSSSDFYFIKDAAGSGTGWTRPNFGGAPSIANIAAEIVAFNSSFGDASGDGVTDLRDAATLIRCLDGPSTGTHTGCGCGSDVDDDGHVDLLDFALLQRSYAGRVGPCSATPGACDDGNACTIDTCNTASGTCRYSAASCDDGDACTVDRCDPDQGCMHTLAACGAVDGCCPAACSYAVDQDCCRPQNTTCTADAQCCSRDCKPNGRCR